VKVPTEPGYYWLREKNGHWTIAERYPYDTPAWGLYGDETYSNEQVAEEFDRAVKIEPPEEDAP
jgi:hypothetical protein